ncbi:LysE family translocator [Maritimibacter sp. UBA3975]|uniref:LysE family translocator n=1 Tax=Maritimibacter sp. UBA3975 TaxID=1946833 RepID=UPI000C0A5510|nr:LysE family translocator [Maritimibacter sp. UBA3975]MAM61876.1 lysine transporter LysE [Maritimibacter sp.]
MTDLVLALLAFLLPLAWSPGPGNVFFAANGARFGLRATLGLSAGYHLATWLVTVGLAAGLAAALADRPAWLSGLRWGGCAYMLWLAYGFLRSGHTRAEVAPQPAGFRDGAVLLLLNPKAYVIILLMLSQFMAPFAAYGGGAMIATLFTLNNLAAFTTWTLAGDLLLRRFRDPVSGRRLNIAFGLLLAGVAVWMALP